MSAVPPSAVITISPPPLFMYMLMMGPEAIAQQAGRNEGGTSPMPLSRFSVRNYQAVDTDEEHGPVQGGMFMTVATPATTAEKPE